MTTYCNATHRDSTNGCYNDIGHPGTHRGFKMFASEPFFWFDEPKPEPVPEGTPVYLTDVELAYLYKVTYCGEAGLLAKIRAGLKEALKE